MNRKGISWALALLLSLFSLLAASLSIAPLEVDAAPSETYVSHEVDLSGFSVLKPSGAPTFAIDEEEGTITSGGGWECNYVGSGQFDTVSNSYYLKAHCYSEGVGDCPDGALGFSIYFDFRNYLNFYLHWNSSNVTGTFDEAAMFGRIDDKTTSSFSVATLPSAEFKENDPSPFYDCWSDYGWTSGDDRDGNLMYNLRSEGAVVLLENGIDLTLYVDRMTYEGKLVDVLQLEVVGLESDKATPRRFFSKKFAVDAFTSPLGGESPFAWNRPQLCFFNNGVGDVTYSDIVFANKKAEAEEPTLGKFSYVGEESVAREIDKDGNMKMGNESAENSSFYVLRNGAYLENRNDFRCHVKGEIGVVDGATLGFVLYYDESDYLTLTFGYSQKVEEVDADTIGWFNIYAKTSDGLTPQGGRNPWDVGNFADMEGVVSYASRYNGFIADAEFPSGADGNFNNFFDNSNLLLSDGYDIGISYYRHEYSGRLVDQFQLSVSGMGKDGEFHVWYTPSYCVDAFTYPAGGETASPLLEATPKIGLYAYKCGEVIFSGFKLNGDPLAARDLDSVYFGSREEGGWTLSGSDYGANWTVGEGTLSEAWDILNPDTYENEVHALSANEAADSYLAATLKLTSSYGDRSYACAYPYYLDQGNYLAILFEFDGESTLMKVSGRLGGAALGGAEWAFATTEVTDIRDGVSFEAGIVGDRLDIYLSFGPKPDYSLSFARQSFGDRALAAAKTGFGFFNASGDVSSYEVGSAKRIHPYAPSDSDKPVIVELGERRSSGYVGEPYRLPSYIALDYLGEEVEAAIEVRNEDGSLYKALAPDENSFTVEQEGVYTVIVSATDAYGLEAESISYEVTFATFYPYGASAPREHLWQAGVVIGVFAGLLGLTAVCAVILIFKNRKEAKSAARLNEKNRAKNGFDGEDE
ncbi:MAG: hypothetical protein K6F32_06030 [Bacilli bacterium]|nr:hypothetical protein [Bacilli bacterium]